MSDVTTLCDDLAAPTLQLGKRYVFLITYNQTPLGCRERELTNHKVIAYIVVYLNNPPAFSCCF